MYTAFKNMAVQNYIELSYNLAVKVRKLIWLSENEIG